MGKEPRILVDDELFLGRLDEQDVFRGALRAVLGPQDGDAPPFIFLLHGEGGMGKSKLTRRFRDIALREAPFEGSLHVLLVDWERERDRNVALQVGRDAITTETVFDALHRACIDAGWGWHLRAYQDAVKRRQEAEREVARALDRETGESRYAAVRDLGAAGLAKLVRLALPVGETGEALAQALLSAGIQVGAEQAAHLHQAADDFLRVRLKPQYYDVFRQPNETLARALAEGLNRVSRSKPLALLLDTYEIVARTDPWLRVAIQNAGPRVMWVIAGRHNLAASRPAERFLGYSAEFPRRLTAWDVRELAIEYVLEYLRDRAPARATSRADAEAIHRATLGVPLAVQAAADLWRRDVGLQAVTEGIPDRAPRDEIVRLMTRRLLIHCDDPADRSALYFLAMQRRPDPQALVAALRPAEDAPFDLTARLDDLARCYSSVRLEGGAQLHEATAAFIREYLLTTEAHATDEVRDLARRAAAAVRARREGLEADLPLLEERCASADWQEATLDLVHWLLWHDEHAAWAEALPRFVEGLGYARDLCQGLLEVIEGFEPALGKDGRKRLQAWRAGLSGRRVAGPFVNLVPFTGSASEEEGRLLEELARWAERATPVDDPYNRERRAILDLRRGELLHRREQYAEALAALQRARQHLPAGGEALKRQLREAFKETGDRLAWQRREFEIVDSLPSQEAAFALTQAIELGVQEAGVYHSLGAVQSKLGLHQASLDNRLKAVELDPQYTWAWNGLGNVYLGLGRYEEAIAAYQRAIALDPKDAISHNNLGAVYADLGRTEEAIAAYQRAIELDPKYALPQMGLAGIYRAMDDKTKWQHHLAEARRLLKPEDYYNLACLESITGNTDAALEHLAKALEIAPGMRDWARRDPDLAFVRDAPRFRELVGEE